MGNPEGSFLTTLAWYNRRTNEAMADIFAVNRDLLEQPGRAYYGSLLGVLAHVVLSDITWLRRVGAEALDEVGVLRLKFDGLAAQPFRDFDEWRDERISMDALIENFCASLSDDGILAEVTYRNSKGDQFRQPRWQLLLQMFNHQTHHRGQIAQILDEEGVANDYSNLVWYLRK
jgi:uncharacterized damage-inducible protein DinB